MKKLSYLGLLILFLVSCSNDDTLNKNQSIEISGYQVRSKSVYQDVSMPTLETVKIGNLQNGKLFSETFESFRNGISQGNAVTSQTYFYNGNLLKSQVDKDSERVREFFYDSNNRMIGATMVINNTSFNYYRFIYVSNNVIHFERITLPYNDTAATIQFRIIIEFDDNENIIKAGKDMNLDGVVENQNLFSYSNNNLVAITNSDGIIQNFDYSSVIDNFSVLADKSWGKINLRIINSEIYASLNALTEFVSANISSQDLLDNEYEVLSTNFYKKKTKVDDYNDPVMQRTTTTEFFFN